MRALLIFLALLVCHPAEADVTVRIKLDGVVLAAKQRGDLFRMLGYYTQLLTNQNYHYPGENLQKTSDEYQTILRQFKEIFLDDEIQQTLAHSQKIWEEIKPELLSATTQKTKKILKPSIMRTLLEKITLLSDDMKKIQAVLAAEVLDPTVREESQAASDILESSAQLSTYYLINTSHLGTLVDQKTITASTEKYQQSYKMLEKSHFAEGKIFQKRFKGLKKIYYFNTMTAEFSKTAVPALMIKKNNKAYLDAFVSLKLITAASTEGIEKTVNMFF